MTHRNRLSALALSGLLAASAGCQGYVFEPVVPVLMEVYNEEVHIPGDVSHFDLLFVVDDSCSMFSVQDSLGNSFDAFIDAVERRNAERIDEGRDPLDFQLAIASTSVYQRMLIVSGENEIIDHRTTYSQGGDHPCLDGTVYDFDAETPYPDGRLMAAPGNRSVLTTQDFLDNPDDALRQFRQNVRLGVCGSVQEQGLEGMKRTLERNPEFFREGSQLVVVFVSDEEDCSDPDGDLPCYVVEGGQSTDVREEPSVIPPGAALGEVDDYARFLRQLAIDRGGSVAMASIVSAVALPDPPGGFEPGICVDPVCVDRCPGYCQNDYCPRFCGRLQQRPGETDQEFADRQASCPGNCYASCTAEPTEGPCFCGGITPGGRYHELTERFSGVTDSICQSDFSETLENLMDIIDAPRCVGLRARPQNDDPSLVMVRIERDGGYISCTPPDVVGEEEGCASGADWAYVPDGELGVADVCLCEASQCELEPGDNYRISVVAQACSADNPC